MAMYMAVYGQYVAVCDWLSLLACRAKSFSAFGPSSDCITERQLSVNLSVFQHQDTSCCLVTDFFRTQSFSKVKLLFSLL